MAHLHVYRQSLSMAGTPLRSITLSENAPHDCTLKEADYLGTIAVSEPALPEMSVAHPVDEAEAVRIMLPGFAAVLAKAVGAPVQPEDYFEEMQAAFRALAEVYHISKKDNV